METQEHDPEHEIITEDLSEEEAVQGAEVEGDDCEAVAEEEGVEADDADDFSSIEDEDEGLEGISQFLEPGGGWGGSEAPVRRAIKIARANGLTVTSTKRSSLSTGSDHHVSQLRAFAADLSNGSSPTPQMDRTARQIAAAIGHPNFRAGVLAVTSGRLRAQLLWRTHVGGNHFNHVHFGVRASGSGGGGGGSGHPRLTDPPMQGEAVRRIQRRLLALGFKPLEVDGVFGKQTHAAVRRFQRDRKLPVDGIVGPKTRAALG